MRIGIVGAGAIGSTFAAALASAHDVVVLVRRREVAQRIASEGIALDDGGGEIEHVRVEAASDPRVLADRDALIVAVKAYATRAALAPLRDVLGADSLVASVQNGLDFEREAREALPAARLAAGSTTQGAILLGPGRVRPIGDGATTFAREDRAHPTTDELAAAFVDAGLAASVVDDIRPILWRKLVVNAAINPLGALTDRPNGAVASDPDLAELARQLAAEAAAVAEAEGIAIGDPWPLVERAARATAANRNSMLQDIDAGRPTENEAIGGGLLRRAAAHGIPVPATAAIVALVRARERGAAR
jgi:2-dehydropantoate 2-reductase